MAIKITETTYDDITGEEGAGTYVIGYQNQEGNAVWREIDLTEKSAEKYLVKLIAVLKEKGRAVADEDAPQVRTAKRKYTKAATTGTAKLGKDESRKIRAWANANGFPTSDRGRISAQIVEQYNIAQESAAANSATAV